ncbi:hypothetical protein ACTJJ0_32760 [Chitinophaga sp. 22321]|uniref:Oxygen tolerance n=1 Tax=Chitinophaga hostae TaxID=2831022 RepID=A0ABS5J9N9_9BACT|nr:hypothetical protein [Chitinophaga hostae]MBS0031810.1 hypothetical protein [Chitinophaga hostae]
MKKSIFLLAWLLSCLSAAVTAQTSATVSVELDGKVNVDTISIPMPLQAGKPIKFSLAGNRPYSVKLGDTLLNERVIRAFNIYGGDTILPAIHVIVNMKVLARPGSYKIAIPIKRADTIELVNLILVRAPAVIDTLTTARIVVSGRCVSGSSALVLKETGKLANANDLTIHAPYFNFVNDSNLVSFKHPVTNLSAGGVLQVFYDLNIPNIKKLPLGKSMGFAQVTSSNLSAPLVIPFEITNKRSNWWICVAIVLGLLAGLGLRHYLADKKQWEQQRMTGFLFIEKIRQESARIQDKEYRQAVGQLLLDLNVLLEKNGGAGYFTGVADADITAKITEVTTAYNALKTDLEKRLKDLNDAVKKLSGSFENGQLEPLVKKGLATVKLSYDLTGDRIRACDPTSAEQTFEQTIVSMKQALKELKNYLLSVQQLFSKDENYPASIPAQLKTTIKDKINSVVQALPDLKDEEKDPQVLTGNVTALNQVSTQLTALLNFYGNSLDGVYKLPADKSAPAVISFMKTLSAWKEKLTDITTNTANSPDAATYFNAAFAGEIDKGWNEVDKLKDRAFGASPIAADQYTFSEAVVQQEDYEAKDVLDTNSPIWQEISAGSATTKKRIVWYGLIQTAVLAVVLCAIAYNTYAAGFIGTFNEILTLFLFAFSIDVTVDTVLKYKAGKIS